MIPLKLYIEGIQSFKELQVVDFEKLSACGLFGIFGKTGSGKSTILDSMMIALYGDAGKNREQKDFINLSCTKAYIKFEFLTSENGGRAKYTVERSFRIRKGGTMDNNANLYKAEEGGNLAVAENIKNTDKALLEIIGLSAEEFRKCVILPQGEFASFIKAQRGDRLKIIGSLFNLEEYGDKLFDKVSTRYYAAENELSNINTAIETLGDFDYAEIDILNQKIKKDNIAAINLKSEKEQKNNQIKEYECIINDVRELNYLKEYQKNLLQKNGEIDFYRKKAEDYKKAAALLPLIGDINKINEEIKNYDIEIFKFNEKQNILNQKFERLSSEKEKNEHEFNNKGQKLKENAAVLNALKPDAVLLSQKTNQRENLIKEFTLQKNSLEINHNLQIKIKAAIEDLNKQIVEIENRTDIEILIKKGYAEGCLFEINDAINYLKNDYKNSLPHFSDKKDIRKYELKEINNNLNESKSFEEDLKTLKILKENKEKQDNNLKNAEKNESNITSEMKRITESGGSLKNDILAINEKFLQAGINGDITSVQIENEIKKYHTDYEILKANRDKSVIGYENCKEEINSAISEINKYNALKTSAGKDLSNKSIRLNENLSASGFADGQEVLNANLSQNDFNSYENKVTQYDSDVSATQKNIDRLSVKLKGSSVDEAFYAKIQGEYSENEANLTKLQSGIAVDFNNLDILKTKKNKLVILKDKQKTLTDLHNNLSKIYGLVKGKNFMEYVAEEYIQDITAAASVHTSHLTGGRFTLLYKGGGFYVSDNYSGGENRSINTLSGGETFLVSLSLAVALSEAIVKMSDKPVEFFFLDEGFGTLDRELCDIVMNTLEKLRRSHFTIGLISHVPELMQRLTCKLIVTPPDENNGSKLTPVYS